MKKTEYSKFQQYFVHFSRDTSIFLAVLNGESCTNVAKANNISQSRASRIVSDILALYSKELWFEAYESDLYLVEWIRKNKLRVLLKKYLYEQTVKNNPASLRRE